MPPPTLPSELITIIIRNLQNENPASYNIGEHEIKALLNLCLTSRTFLVAAAPVLYSRIIIKDGRQILTLKQTVSSENTIIGLHPGRWIEALCFRDFDDAMEPKYMEALSNILNKTTNLCRLIIDRCLRQTWTYLHESRELLRVALEQLKVIEELISIQDELFVKQTPDDSNSETSIPEMYDDGQVFEPLVEELLGDYCSGWSSRTTLRRLALYNPLVDEEFVDRVKRLGYLDHISLTRPDPDDDEDIMHHESYLVHLILLQRGEDAHARHLQKVMLINWGWDVDVDVNTSFYEEIRQRRIEQHLLGNATAEFVGGFPHEVNLATLQHGQSRALQLYVRDMMEEGIFWTAESDDFEDMVMDPEDAIESDNISNT